MSEDAMTKRILKAMENKYMTILGHPTGRLLLERPPYAVNMTKVIDGAAERGVVLEINAQPKRLDTDWRLLSYAKEKGCKFSIDPDAHNTASVGYFRFGVGIARKGWLTKEDVINTIPSSRIAGYVKMLRQGH